MLAYLKGIRPEQVDDSEGREVVLTIAGNPLELSGEQYLLHYAMLNFYFHCTATRAILRQCGAAIGKRDFIGSLQESLCTERALPTRLAWARRCV